MALIWFFLLSQNVESKFLQRTPVIALDRLRKSLPEGNYQLIGWQATYVIWIVSPPSSCAPVDSPESKMRARSRVCMRVCALHLFPFWTLKIYIFFFKNMNPWYKKLITGLWKACQRFSQHNAELIHVKEIHRRVFVCVCDTDEMLCEMKNVNVLL